MDRKQSSFTQVSELEDSDFIPSFGMNTNKKISKADFFDQIKDETQIFIYPTIELLQAANLVADPDWPVYVRVEETEYRIYKITTLAAGGDDISLNNGATATFQNEYYVQVDTNAATEQEILDGITNEKIVTPLGASQAILRTFDTPAQAALASLTVGSKYSTKGADAIGDGGHGDFIVTATPPAILNGYSGFENANGTYSELLQPFNEAQLGIFNSNSIDVSAKMQDYIDIYPSGATVRLSVTEFNLGSDVDLGGRVIEHNGRKFGAGEFTNASKIVISRFGQVALASGSTFGNGFQSEKIIYVNADYTHPSSESNLALIRVASGSGEFGPSRADFCLHIDSIKADYLTSTVQGEINGQYVNVRQGSLGDAAGILIDVEKVGGTEGGALGIEASCKFINSSGTITQNIQSGMAFNEGSGGFSGGTGFGFWTEARTASPYSAYHANNHDTGTFQNFLTFGTSRNPASLQYRVDNTGRTFGSLGSAASPAFSFVGDPDTGIYRVATNSIGFAIGGVLHSYFNATAWLFGTDNTIQIGTSGNRVTNIYLTNAPIVTSDRRSKQQEELLSEKELKVAKKLKSLICKFKLNDDVDKHKDAAKIHFGIIAQDVIEAFETEGLNASDYEIVKHEEWPDEYAIEDEYSPAVKIRSAGDRYGVRYEQLVCFIISAL